MSEHKNRPDREKIEELVRKELIKNDDLLLRIGRGHWEAVIPIVLALIPDEATIIREEQKRAAGALRVLFEKGWTLNDLIQAEDTMEDEYTNIIEEAKKQERERIYGKWNETSYNMVGILGKSVTSVGYNKKNVDDFWQSLKKEAHQ